MREFSAWWDGNRLGNLVDIEPVHIAAYVELLGQRLAAPSVKQHLAALRMLFDWLVVGPGHSQQSGRGRAWPRA
ncbi:site-specific integrase [Paraburkholderia atlantica]|uniref:site-specific integrase n=1 Tax=Paraburkholderia atlantica TaxID=2654982 RepID=UPI00288BA56B|nr:site-specific integrase [Paraburkholderia atlantica]